MAGKISALSLTEAVSASYFAAEEIELSKDLAPSSEAVEEVLEIEQALIIAENQLGLLLTG